MLLLVLMFVPVALCIVRRWSSLHCANCKLNISVFVYTRVCATMSQYRWCWCLPSSIVHCAALVFVALCKPSRSVSCGQSPYRANRPHLFANIAQFEQSCPSFRRDFSCQSASFCFGPDPNNCTHICLSGASTLPEGWRQKEVVFFRNISLKTGGLPTPTPSLNLGIQMSLLAKKSRVFKVKTSSHQNFS